LGNTLAEVKNNAMHVSVILSVKGFPCDRHWNQALFEERAVSVPSEDMLEGMLTCKTVTTGDPCGKTEDKGSIE